MFIGNILILFLSGHITWPNYQNGRIGAQGINSLYLTAKPAAVAFNCLFIFDVWNDVTTKLQDKKLWIQVVIHFQAVLVVGFCENCS